jgi:hypothetical protein
MDAASHGRTTGEAGLPRLGRCVLALDRWLRRQQSVMEYTRNPHCLFRISIGRLDREVALSDGTVASASARVIDLHLWNEHIPRMPKQGATLTWARLALDRLEASLRELAHYLAAHPEFDDITMLRGNAACGVAEQRPQIVRIARQYDFEVMGNAAQLTIGRRVHRFGENILISLIIWTCNAAALRGDALRRDRVELFLSRRLLARRSERGRRVDIRGEAAPCRSRMTS